MSDTTFYFTKYEVSGNLATLMDYDPERTREEREREILEEYIQTDGPVVDGSTGTWYFGAVELEQNYALGKFGKVYTEEPTTYDEEVGDFIDDTLPNREADYSMFILHFDPNLLIYNTKNRIGHQQFRKYFAQGLEENYGERISLETEYIRNTDEIETVLTESTVLEASFELEPSNPSSEPEWENLDESIQEMLAERLEIIAESEEGQGLNMDEDLLEQAVEMAQTRYGINYRIVYDDDGQIKTINKTRSPVQKEEEKPANLGGLRARATNLIGYATSYLNEDG